MGSEMSISACRQPYASWPLRKLSDVAQINSESLSSATPKQHRFQYIDISSVTEGRVNWSDVSELEFETAPSRARRITRAGDVLICTVRPGLKAHAFADWPPSDRVICSTGFAVVRPLPALDSRFLHHLVFSDIVSRQLQTWEMGTGYPAVNERDVGRLLIPSPPLNEQRAIARILDAADAAIDRTRAAIATARKVRLAIVQQFFESGVGRIISADRPGNHLAKGWRLKATGSLLATEPKNGISPRTQAEPPGYITFSIAAVRNGRVDLLNREHWKYARLEPKVADAFLLRRGDLLIVRGNANANLVGRCGIVEDLPPDCIYPDILKRVTFQESADGVLPQYVALAWNHPLVHNQVLKKAKTSNGTLKVNSRDVSQIVLPVPPQKSQNMLLEKVAAADRQINALMSSMSSLERLKRGLMQDLLTGRVRVAGTPPALSP